MKFLETKTLKDLAKGGHTIQYGMKADELAVTGAQTQADKQEAISAVAGGSDEQSSHAGKPRPWKVEKSEIRQ